MESSLLRSGVAAAQLALRTPVKKEEGDAKEEDKPEGRVQISPDFWYVFVHVFLLCFNNKFPQNTLISFPSCNFKPTKEKGDDSMAKKRKTEWQAAVKKLPGDTTFVQAWVYFVIFNVLTYTSIFYISIYSQLSRYFLTSPDEEVLNYLVMFTEPAAAGTTGLSAHPVDLVMQSFQVPEDVPLLLKKCQGFLEEAMQVHGKTMEHANIPDIWSVSVYIFENVFCFKSLLPVVPFFLHFAEMIFFS